VDVDLGNRVKARSLLARTGEGTHGPEVLGKIGGFGGLFRADFKGMKDPVLVSSVDGVGTKLKVAFAMNRHETVGTGSRQSLRQRHRGRGRTAAFFSRLHRRGTAGAGRLRRADQGLRESLQGSGLCANRGETAQLPGMYQRGEYDSRARSSASSIARMRSMAAVSGPAT